jgi:hypothetical protein
MVICDLLYKRGPAPINIRFRVESEDTARVIVDGEPTDTTVIYFTEAAAKRINQLRDNQPSKPNAQYFSPASVGYIDQLREKAFFEQLEDDEVLRESTPWCQRAASYFFQK